MVKTVPQKQIFMAGEIALGAITGGTSLLSSIYNAAQQRKMNAENRAFALEQYQRQRADAISDWDRANLYNSPSEQMKRFKDAGLNPNLIYGQMSNSPAIKTPETSIPEGKAPQIENPVPAAISAYFDAQIKDQQIQNLKAVEHKTNNEAAAAAATARERNADAQLKEETLPYNTQYALGRERLIGQQFNNAVLANQKVASMLPLQMKQAAATYDKTMQDILTGKAKTINLYQSTKQMINAIEQTNMMNAKKKELMNSIQQATEANIKLIQSRERLTEQQKINLEELLPYHKLQLGGGTILKAFSPSKSRR